MKDIYGPAHEILVLFASASSKGTDEPVHSCSLVRVLAAGIHKVHEKIRLLKDFALYPR